MSLLVPRPSTPDPRLSLSAVILAGGQSSRMGRDKAWLDVGGRPLLARQIQLARESGAAEVFVSGRPDRDYSEFGCPVLRDKFADAGPLAGIERALAVSLSPLLLVLAVDLPEMNVDLLQRLLVAGAENSGVVPRVGGQIEPLAAWYPKAAHSLVETMLESQTRAVFAFAERCVQSGLARFLDLPASDAKYFTNWNAPADLALKAAGL